MCAREERSQIPNITIETDPLPRVFGPSFSQGLAVVLRPDKQRSSSLLVTRGTNDFSWARKIVTRLGPADRLSPRFPRYFRRDFRNRLFKGRVP